MNPTDTALAALAAWEARDVNAVAALLSDDYVITGHSPEPGDKPMYLVFQQIHNEGFPDWQFHPRVVEAHGDQVLVAIQITATHTGPWDVSRLGLPIPAVQATGKYRQWPAEKVLFTVKGGKITAMHIEMAPEGGVIGTLVWLGVPLPAPER